MNAITPLKHPAERRRSCRHCGSVHALAWQPNCEAHAYVGPVFDVPVELHSDDGDREIIEHVTAKAIVTMDPIEQEWLIGPVKAKDSHGRPRTLDRNELLAAEDALMWAAQKAIDDESAKSAGLPFVVDAP